MASTLTLRGAEVSMKALQSGAADYVTKPSSTRELGAADSFKRELVSKVKALAIRPGAPDRATGPASAASGLPHH